MKHNTTTTSALASVLIATAATLPHLQGQTAIDFVNVGNAGNAADNFSGSSYGNVAYDYQISKYEVTISQYTAFLNAVAASDTYNLWDGPMGYDPVNGSISRNGNAGSYSYSVIGSGDRPITFISWADAARFVNWLENGQPTGAQGVGTTETGSYTLNGFSNIIVAESGANYRLPTEDEWYKAAYYNPTLGNANDGDNYHQYATLSNTLGSNDASFDGGSIDYIVDVGTFSDKPSYYGTFDQSGNVAEIVMAEESTIYTGLVALRGGAYTLADLYASSNPATRLATIDDGDNTNAAWIGFRVVRMDGIPEPSSVSLLVIGALGCVMRRKRG